MVKQFAVILRISCKNILCRPMVSPSYSSMKLAYFKTVISLVSKLIGKLHNWGILIECRDG